MNINFILIFLICLQSCSSCITKDRKRPLTPEQEKLVNDIDKVLNQALDKFHDYVTAGEYNPKSNEVIDNSPVQQQAGQQHIQFPQRSSPTWGPSDANLENDVKISGPNDGTFENSLKKSKFSNENSSEKLRLSKLFQSGQEEGIQIRKLLDPKQTQ